MTYKETLFFIGKCLTIAHEEHNRTIIESLIKKETFDWDNVVKVGTAHFVFPALYCNLQRVNFLQFLPDELVGFMEHITNLNRERNTEIIREANEINTLLLKNNITPIFLKGTGNLLEGLYDDIAERMVGDIDFLVQEKDFLKAAKLLEENNYEKTSKGLISPVFQKHYPRLFNEDKIAAVEVHLDMLKGKKKERFNYQSIKDSAQKINDIQVMSYTDQITLTTMAIQHNDNGFYYKTVSLRNCYDVFLLSQKTNSLNSINKYKSFTKLLNSYFAITAVIFNSNVIKFQNNLRTSYYLWFTQFKLRFTSIAKLHNTVLKTMRYAKLKLQGFIRFLTNKDFRKYYIKKLSS